MGFWIDFYPKIEPKSTRNHSNTALFRCFFCDAFFLCFFLISAQFSRSPNLRNRAGAYSTVVFSRNRRFRFRSSLSMDFGSFSPHFRPQNAPKWPPGPSREKIDFWYLFSRFGDRFLGPFGPLGETFFGKKTTRDIGRTHFLALQDALGSILCFFYCF